MLRKTKGMTRKGTEKNTERRNKIINKRSRREQRNKLNNYLDIKMVEFYDVFESMFNSFTNTDLMSLYEVNKAFNELIINKCQKVKIIKIRFENEYIYSGYFAKSANCLASENTNVKNILDCDNLIVWSKIQISSKTIEDNKLLINCKKCCKVLDITNIDSLTCECGTSNVIKKKHGYK